MPHDRRPKTSRRARLFAMGAAASVGLSLLAFPAKGGEFILGSADVKSQFLAVSPETAGLSAGMVVGETLADFSNDVARAQSRAINTGIVGTSAIGDKCDGGEPDLQKDDLPTTVRVDSREPGAAAGSTDYWPIFPRDLPYQFAELKEENGGVPNLDPPPDSPARINHSRLFAQASGQPSSLSTSDTAVTYVAGVADVIGGHTSTAARIENGKRIGEAVVVIPELRLGGGAVVLRDLEWRVTQTTGDAAPADATFDASFHIGSITTGGATYGWPEEAGAEFQTQVGALLNLVNTALAPTGLVVAFPRAAQDGGHAIITPLEVRIDRPPLGRELFAMLPPEVYEARREIFDRAIEARCSFATFVVVGDIVLATPAGSGATRVSFGGADAFTEGTEYANPFSTRRRGGATPFVAPVSSDDLTFAPAPQVLGAQATSLPIETLVGPSHGDGGIPGGDPTVAAGTFSIPGSKSGTAAIVGIIGLLAVASVALLDFMKPRRVQQGAGAARAGIAGPSGPRSG